MRYAISWIAVWLSIAAAFGQGQANPVSQSPDTASSRDADNQLIRQIETDWLKAERTTDPSVVDRVLADDWVNLTPTGIGPGKAAVLKNFREHTGGGSTLFGTTAGLAHFYPQRDIGGRRVREDLRGERKQERCPRRYDTRIHERSRYMENEDLQD
jgi:hypothetical protein